MNITPRPELVLLGVEDYYLDLVAQAYGCSADDLHVERWMWGGIKISYKHRKAICLFIKADVWAESFKTYGDFYWIVIDSGDVANATRMLMRYLNRLPANSKGLNARKGPFS